MANPTRPDQDQVRDAALGQQQGQEHSQATQAQSPQPQQQRPGLQRMRRELPVTGMVPTPFMFGPFALMRRLFDDLAQLAGGSEPSSELDQLPGMFVPQIDVQQRDDRIVVHVDLPGTAPADVQLRIEDNALILEGERRIEHEQEQGGVVRTERVYGRFQRVISLPEGADPEGAEARFANGVLEVTIKTPQRRKGRRIEIQAGAEQPRAGAGERQGAKDTAKH